MEIVLSRCIPVETFTLDVICYFILGSCRGIIRGFSYCVCISLGSLFVVVVLFCIQATRILRLVCLANELIKDLFFQVKIVKQVKKQTVPETKEDVAKGARQQGTRKQKQQAKKSTTKKNKRILKDTNRA